MTGTRLRSVVKVLNSDRQGSAGRIANAVELADGTLLVASLLFDAIGAAEADLAGFHAA